ncbi:MAG: hypothetical protein VR69_04610 [Peptococcaceae bacterium BRH_c4b]|nr:MAG: hypothetical protein VR69_04610 [Peptococcaceae bacterium BRH_c4b]
MWNIIAKDLYLQRVRLALVAVLAGAAMGVMFIGTDLRNGGLYPAVLIFALGLTYSYTLFSCFHEDKNKSISFLRSLPVSARTVVNSKFAAMIVLEAVLLILLFLYYIWGICCGLP